MCLNGTHLLLLRLTSVLSLIGSYYFPAEYFVAKNLLFFTYRYNIIACINRRLAYVHSLMDPWGSEVKNSEAAPEFEDNFEPTCEFEKLSDSEQYLAVLERKLKAIRKKNKVVENLSAYRADCIDRLMREGCDLDPVIGDTEEEQLIQDQQE